MPWRRLAIHRKPLRGSTRMTSGATDRPVSAAHAARRPQIAMNNAAATNRLAANRSPAASKTSRRSIEKMVCMCYTSLKRHPANFANGKSRTVLAALTKVRFSALVNVLKSPSPK